MGLPLRRIFRPLIKVLIARGVTAPMLYRLLKGLYVEVAERDFRLGNDAPTDSRISVLTGVHRKDVRALRQPSPHAEAASARDVTVMATVVGRWLADPDRSAKGTPLPLPRQAKDGPSFDDLVQTVSTDVRPRTILDELLRRGIVALSDDGETVSLSSEAFVDGGTGDERFHFFSRNVGDHLAAAGENVLAEGTPPFLERAVFYNNLTAASLDEIEDRAQTLGKAALAELNGLAYERQQADAGADGAGHRFRFGVYLYREDEDSVLPAGPDSTDDP